MKIASKLALPPVIFSLLQRLRTSQNVHIYSHEENQLSRRARFAVVQPCVREAGLPSSSVWRRGVGTKIVPLSAAVEAYIYAPLDENGGMTLL